ncbi:hypothetical protein TNCV_3664371 [Trichonephila clavipes]|nr:hypothetical protein TNCV_3664371 [Trichonephila clavipes]
MSGSGPTELCFFAGGEMSRRKRGCAGAAGEGGRRKPTPFLRCRDWDEKIDGDCKAKLAAGTVGFEAGVSLFTDPNSDVGKCI